MRFFQQSNNNLLKILEELSFRKKLQAYFYHCSDLTYNFIGTVGVWPSSICFLILVIWALYFFGQRLVYCTNHSWALVLISRSWVLLLKTIHLRLYESLFPGCDLDMWPPSCTRLRKVFPQNRHMCTAFCFLLGEVLNGTGTMILTFDSGTSFL